MVRTLATQVSARDYLRGHAPALPARESTRLAAALRIVLVNAPIRGKGIPMSDLIERYLACWNEADAATRRALIAQNWTEDLSYVDPMVEVSGADELDSTIGAVQEQFPGFVFTPAGPVDAHHDIARFTWGLGPAGAEPLVV